MTVKTAFFYSFFVLVWWSKGQAADLDICQHPCTKDNQCKVSGINNTCYYKFRESKSWEKSQELCSSKGMQMLRHFEELNTDDLALNEEGSTGTFSNEAYVWLGGRAEDLKEWTFLNDVLLSKTNDNRTSIKDSSDMHHCGTLQYEKKGKDLKYSMSTAACGQENYFICRFDDWMGKLSYYVSETKTNWYKARSRCKQLGGDLFYLNERHLFQEISDKLKPGSAIVLYIGLHHRIWKWEDGQEVILEFERRKDFSAGDCLALNIHDRQFVEKNCTEKLNFICEVVHTNATDGALSCSTMIFTLAGSLGASGLINICLLVFCSNLCRNKKSKPAPSRSNPSTPADSSDSESSVKEAEIAPELNEMYSPPFRAEIRKVLKSAHRVNTLEEEMENPFYEAI